MGRTKQYTVCLADSEREALHAFVSSGHKSARQITRARILLLADAGKTDREIIDLLSLSRPTVFSMRKKYSEGGYDHILDVPPAGPRRGRPIQVDSRVEAHISMIACSEPPEGAARWTLHLIADKLVKLDVIDTISRERVRQALKKTASSRG